MRPLLYQLSYAATGNPYEKGTAECIALPEGVQIVFTREPMGANPC